MTLVHVSRRSPGEGHGNPLQYSCLENPIERGGTWRATVHRVAKSQTQLKQLSTHACTYKDAAITPHITPVDSWGPVHYLKYFVLEFCKTKQNKTKLCNLFKDPFSHPFETRIKNSEFTNSYIPTGLREMALNKLDSFIGLIKSIKHAISRWCNKFY